MSAFHLPTTQGIRYSRLSLALDPRVKVGVFILCAVIVAVMPVGNFIVLLSFTVLLLALVALLRIQIHFLFIRMLMILPFILVILLTIPWMERVNDNPMTLYLILFGFKTDLSLDNLLLTLWMFSRALLAIGFLSALTLSTPTQDIITGLQGLKLPSIIVLTLNLTIRYLFVLREEFIRLHKSWNSRYFGKYFWYNVASIGKRLGILFIRTTERAERVSNCMLSRGFDIHRLQTAKLHINRVDLLFLVCSLLALSAVIVFAVLSSLVPDVY